MCKVVLIEYMNDLLAVVRPQARSPEGSAGEGGGERSAGANHWERSQRDFPGKALQNTHLFIFVLKWDTFTDC